MRLSFLSTPSPHTGHSNQNQISAGEKYEDFGEKNYNGARIEISRKITIKKTEKGP